MSEIKINTRVLIKVPDQYSADSEVTGRVIYCDDIECAVILDPKYHDSEWGFIPSDAEKSRYGISDDMSDQRFGVVPAKECGTIHTIKNVLPETSQRRLP